MCSGGRRRQPWEYAGMAGSKPPERREPAAHGSARSRAGTAQALRACGATAPKLVLYARFVVLTPLPKYHFMLVFFFPFHIFSF